MVSASRLDLAHAGNGLHAVFGAVGGRGVKQRHGDHSCEDGFDTANEESGAKSVTKCVAKSVTQYVTQPIA